MVRDHGQTKGFQHFCRDPWHGPWLGLTAGYVLLHFSAMVVTESASSQGQAPAIKHVE